MIEAWWDTPPPPPSTLDLKKKVSCYHEKGARQKELKFYLQSARHCFFECPLRCDPSRFVNKVITIVFRMQFATICRNLPPRLAIGSPFFLVGPDVISNKDCTSDLLYPFIHLNVLWRSNIR